MDQNNSFKEKHKEEKGRYVSRRELLATMGALGAATVTGFLFTENRGKAGSAEQTKAEGMPERSVQIVRINELRSSNPNQLKTVYFISDPGKEGLFVQDESDSETPDDGALTLAASNGIRYKRVIEGMYNVKWFGAAGDGSHDDTEAVRQALAQSRGKTLFFPPGVYKLTDTIEIPRNTFVRGSGNSSWFPFGQRRNELPHSILDMENGTVLCFEGNGSGRYSSNRSDFQDFTCAVKLEADGDGIQLHDLKILSSFRIRDDNGQITTPLTDQHAMFDVGLWIDNATHVKLDKVSVVGYWQKAGCFVDASGRLSTHKEYGSVEYTTIRDSIFQGQIGLALLGGDEGNPPDHTGFTPISDQDDLSEGQFGLSHLFVSDSFFSGMDHHSNGFVSGWQDRMPKDSAAIKIDGFIGSGIPYRINHPRFVNCSIQTRESASIILDRVNRPSFVNCRAESGPVRATQHTTLPRLINCEFPYNRTNPAYQEIEQCQGAYIAPPLRRLGQVYLRDYVFDIALRNNNGVIEHRVLKSGGLQNAARSLDAEAVFRYPIQEAGWDYRAWSATPMPGSGEADAFSKGIFLGEKSTSSKYNLITCAALDNHPDYQEVEVELIRSRAADQDLWVRAEAAMSSNVPYKMQNYSTVLKIELRNGDSPATNLSQNLPNEQNGDASVVIRVRGKFYEQSYGL